MSLLVVYTDCTLFSRHISILLFSMSLYFPNDPHPTAILLLISSVLSFSIFTNCPKYTYSSTFSTSSPPTWTSFLLTYSLYITLVFLIFIFTPSFLLSLFNSFSISSVSSQLLPISTMSSANLRWFNCSPFIVIPLLSQLSLLNTCSSPALNNFGESVSPCLTPF